MFYLSKPPPPPPHTIFLWSFSPKSAVQRDMCPLFSDTLHQVWFQNLKQRSYGSLCICSFKRADSKVHLQGGGGCCLCSISFYVFLRVFSPRANGDERILSLFPGPPYGARLQRPHTNHIMCLLSVFTRLTNTKNMPCNRIFRLFCQKHLQHVFIWSFSQNRPVWAFISFCSLDPHIRYRFKSCAQLADVLGLLVFALSKIWFKWTFSIFQVSSVQNSFNNMAWLVGLLKITFIVMDAFFVR